MFGLGFWELIVVFAVVIVFVNPKDLPLFFRRLGKIVKRIRVFNRSISRGIELLAAEEEESTPKPAKPRSRRPEETHSREEENV